MRMIEIEELKQLQLEILLKVHKFCVDNNIEYSLDWGTLLGAIRHKGYIPWDDDIDILMTRPNYEKFIHSFNGRVTNLHVLAPELNWNYYATYANVCDKRTVLLEDAIDHNDMEVGVKIDVFPIDGCQDKYAEYEKLYKQSRSLNNILLAKRAKLSRLFFKNIKRSLYLLYLRLVNFHRSYSRIQKQINSLTDICPYINANYASLIVCNFKEFRMKKNVFETYIDMEYEGHMVKGIQYYDEYLKALYGDYMQLPPENERVYQHGFSAYWKK